MATELVIASVIVLLGAIAYGLHRIAAAIVGVSRRLQNVTVNMNSVTRLELPPEPKDAPPTEAEVGSLAVNKSALAAGSPDRTPLFTVHERQKAPPTEADGARARAGARPENRLL